MLFASISQPQKPLQAKNEVFSRRCEGSHGILVSLRSWVAGRPDPGYFQTTIEGGPGPSHLGTGDAVQTGRISDTAPPPC
jgi:hypothetical protein